MIKKQDVQFEENGKVVAHQKIYEAFQKAREKNSDQSSDPYAQLLLEIFTEKLKGKLTMISIGGRGWSGETQTFIEGIKLAPKNSLKFVEIPHPKWNLIPIYSHTEIRILEQRGGQ